MTPELHRPLMLDRIGPNGLDITVDATPEECAALSRRMHLPAVQSLSCSFHLTRESDTVILVRGTLRAHITQSCIVSLEDFDAAVEDAFQVRFVPAGQESEEIDFDADDEIPYEGKEIDLGEAAAEQLALALDPYPRHPDAELPEVEGGADAHPFAALRRLN
jgi:uncharacterized metal-binding protein YceD (DUF177 family)